MPARDARGMGLIAQCRDVVIDDDGVSVVFFIYIYTVYILYFSLFLPLYSEKINRRLFVAYSSLLRHFSWHNVTRCAVVLFRTG